LIKNILNNLRLRLRFLVFDKKRLISEFTYLSISNQKKELIRLIELKKFLLLEKFIITKNKKSLNDLFNHLNKNNFKKIYFIYIYSFLVNIREFKLAKTFHELLCKNVKKNSFFYYQICTINKENISEFKSFSKTIKFFLIYNFLLFEGEKNYIKTILQLDNNSFEKINNLNKFDNEFKEYIKKKDLCIIGPLDKKINLKKKEINNSLIIRFKNNTYLRKKELRTNIIYFNGTTSIEYHKKKNFIKKEEDLIWLIYIEKNFFNKFYKNDQFKKRFANNTSAFLFTCFSELNLLQKVLLDLYLFNPKKIKLYNFDIYLSKLYRTGYGKYNLKRKTKKKIQVSFLHNQIIMFDFINFFYKKKKILLDKTLKNIITSGKDKYLYGLEQTWK
tara:strand:- start:3832 stop:4995 length:1164 start_codon:yes stop_codon:yes gene_type:complete